MNPFLSLVGRKALLLLGAYLVDKGYLRPSELEGWVNANMALVLGAGAIGLSLGWSVLDKIKNSIFDLVSGKPKPLFKIEETIQSKSKK